MFHAVENVSPNQDVPPFLKPMSQPNDQFPLGDFICGRHDLLDLGKMLAILFCVLICADILPEGYSPCHHPNCARRFRMVTRNKYQPEYRYRERFCQDSKDPRNYDELPASPLISQDMRVATSQAVIITQSVTLLPPANFQLPFIPKDGATLKKTRRSRTIDLHHRRSLKINV